MSVSQPKQKSVDFGAALKNAGFSGSLFFQLWEENPQAAKLAFVSLDLRSMGKILEGLKEELDRTFFFQFSKKENLEICTIICRNRYNQAHRKRRQNEEKQNKKRQELISQTSGTNSTSSENKRQSNRLTFEPSISQRKSESHPHNTQSPQYLLNRLNEEVWEDNLTSEATSLIKKYI